MVVNRARSPARAGDDATRPRNATRQISSLHPVDGELHFSQALPEWKMTWGLDLLGGFRERVFRLTEIETKKVSPYLILYTEHRLAPDLTLRVEANGINMRAAKRIREVYAGPRSLGRLTYTDYRDLEWGGNLMVRLRNEIANAFAMIDVQLKRRHDLIPNLVEVARKYLEHERETLERVTAARAQAMAACDMVRSKPLDASRIQSLSMAEGSLASALGRFQAVVESYPELQADGHLRELNEELRHTENKVAFARQFFNDATLSYNNAAQQFPTNALAGVFGFRTAAMLASTSSEAEREPIRVQL